jgi:hypothetical protein
MHHRLFGSGSWQVSSLQLVAHLLPYPPLGVESGVATTGGESAFHWTLDERTSGLYKTSLSEVLKK